MNILTSIDLWLHIVDKSRVVLDGVQDDQVVAMDVRNWQGDVIVQGNANIVMGEVVANEEVGYNKLGILQDI
jgi:predicted transcriptional regulator